MHVGAIVQILSDSAMLAAGGGKEFFLELPALNRRGEKVRGL